LKALWHERLHLERINSESQQHFTLPKQLLPAFRIKGIRPQLSVFANLFVRWHSALNFFERSNHGQVYFLASSQGVIVDFGLDFFGVHNEKAPGVERGRMN